MPVRKPYIYDAKLEYTETNHIFELVTDARSDFQKVTTDIAHRLRGLAYARKDKTMNEEEYRAKRREQSRKRLENPEYRAAENARKNEQRRKRMADPEYRAAWNEYRNEWRRKRYETDEEFRARTKTQRKASLIKRRKLLPGVDCEVFDYQEIFKRDGWICQLCFDPVDPEFKAPHRWSATLDHIKPLSKGGPHTKANSQLAHYSCNCSKKQNY